MMNDTIPEISIFYNNKYLDYGESFLVFRKGKNPYICTIDTVHKVYSFDDKLEKYFDYYASSRGFIKILEMKKNEYRNYEITWSKDPDNVLKKKLNIIRNNLYKYFTNKDKLDYGVLDILISKIKK